MGGRDFRQWSVERSTCSLIVFGSSENEVPSRGLREILRPRPETKRKKGMLGAGETGGVIWVVTVKRGRESENDIPASYQVLLKTAIVDAVTERWRGRDCFIPGFSYFTWNSRRRIRAPARGRWPGLGTNGYNAKSPIGKDVEARDADE